MTCSYLQDSFLLEALREFPDVTEEELISALEGWKSWRDKYRGGGAGLHRDTPLAGEVADNEA